MGELKEFKDVNDIKNMRWKYLRESNKKYFNPDRNTSLKDYLEYMFQGHEFVYDQQIPKDVVSSRNSTMKYRKFRPDARCEELGLIVEFDGVTHYQDLKICLSDINRDIYLTTLGYKIVRIPYWIQLSNAVIHHLFNDFDEYLTIGDDPMCTLDRSFFDVDKSVIDIGISLGAMCSAGHERFINEVQQFCPHIQMQVYEDICSCIGCAEEFDIPSKYIIPTDVILSWGIEDMILDSSEVYMPIDSILLREHVLFNQDFILANYVVDGFRSFNIPYYAYQELCKSNLFYVPDGDDKILYDDIIDIIEVLGNGNYNFEIMGVALSPLREDCTTNITGFNLYTTDTFDSVVSRIYGLRTKYAKQIESEKLFVESGIAPAGNTHIAVWFN